jgi:hypothetical protein
VTHSWTLLGLKRPIELVYAGGETLSVVLAEYSMLAMGALDVTKPRLRPQHPMSIMEVPMEDAPDLLHIDIGLIDHRRPNSVAIL